MASRALTRRRFTVEDVAAAIDAPLQVIGHSTEGRPLHLLEIGDGATKVLLWSQIHGDEPTGTMILADLAVMLRDDASDVARQLRSRLTLVMLPMLNPDGAARFHRVNGQGLDPNRDARAWVTPEARALREVHEKYQPRFAIDLHDQDPRKLVGDSQRFVAYSVMAPKPTEKDGDDAARRRSKQLACVAYHALVRHFDGHVSRYPETFEPRGLDEYMQKRGTSVVLLEAGGWAGDFEKQQLRAAGLDAVVAVLRAVAGNEFSANGPTDYDRIPQAGRPGHDLIIRGATLVRDGRQFEADVAVNFAAPFDRRGGRVAELGDLQDECAFDEIDGEGLFLRHAERKAVEKEVTADFELTTSLDEDADIAYIVEDGRVLRPAEALDAE